MGTDGAKDIISIGLTPEAEAVLDKMDEKAWFPSQESAAKFAMAIAINHDQGQEDGETPEKTFGAKTVWTLGTFDRDGEIRNLIIALYPDCDTPVKKMRELINRGFALMTPLVEKAGATPNDLFESLAITPPN